jgi:hypothetical protein
MLDDRELGRLQIGAPFWDIAVPVVASFHRPIVFVRSPLIFHQVHEAQWSDEDYDRLRLVAINAILGHARRFRQSSLAARRFLHVAEGLIGTTASIRNRREAKLMARLVDAWLNRLEEAGSKAIIVDVSDPVLCAVAHAAGSDLQPFWMAESRWGRKTPPQGVLRNALRRWRKARERNRWDARLAEADWSVS